MSDSLRQKLFRLLSASLDADASFFIPDCLGEFSRFLDPLHDDCGRDFTTCFLVDAEGRVGIFSNRWEVDYVPFNLLFHLKEYNECRALLFHDVDDIVWPEPEQPRPEYCQRNVLLEYAEGTLSVRRAGALLRQGRLHDCVETLVLLGCAFWQLGFSRGQLRDALRCWKLCKRYYQKKGLYFFAPHPESKRLVRLFTPNRPCDARVAALARTMGQRLPLSFAEVRDIGVDFLKKSWLSDERGRRQG